MPELVTERAGEKRLEYVDVDDAARVDRDAAGRVHPGVGRKDTECAEEPGRRKREADQEVGTRAQALPAVEVDADEDRLHEEGQALDCKPEAEGGAEAAHHSRPQDPELEREDRPGDRADRELHGHDDRPAAGDGQRDLVLAPDADALHQEGQGRERDAQGDE